MQQEKQLAKNTLILAVGKICTQSFSFFLLPLYTAVLSTEEYGIVDLIVTYTGLLLPLVYFQFDQAIFRFLIDVREKGREREQIISTIFIFSVLQIILVAGIFVLVQGFLSSAYKWFLLYMTVASVASAIMLQIARGLGDTLGYTLGSSLSAAVQIVCNVVFLLVLDMGAEGMLLATVLGHVSAAVFLFIKEKTYRDISPKNFDSVMLKQMLRYCIPLVPNQLSWWAISASDRVIVSTLLGNSFTGLLSVGNKFSTMFVAVYNIFHLAWSESAALYIQAPEDERNAFFSHVITDMFRLFTCAGIGVIACMPFVFPILVNDNFADAYGLVPFYMLATLFHTVTGLYAAIYVALKETKEIAKTSMMAGIINVISHLLLINSCGLYAAAFSTVIGYATMTISRYIHIQKYVSVRLNLRTVLAVAGLYLLTTWAYFSKNMLLQGAVLLFVAFFSVCTNKKLLLKLYDSVMKKMGLRNG